MFHFLNIYDTLSRVTVNMCYLFVIFVIVYFDNNIVELPNKLSRNKRE